MAVPTLATLRTHIRALCLDASTTEPHNTDAEILRLLNEHYESAWSKEARYSVVRSPAVTGYTDPENDPIYDATGDTGLTISSGSVYEFEPSGDYDEIVSVHYEGRVLKAVAEQVLPSNGVCLRHGTILSMVEMRDITYMRQNSILAGSHPRYCHVRRKSIESAGTTVPKWAVTIHPAPANASVIQPAYFSLVVKKRYVPLSANGDIPDLHPVTCYGMARAVAWELASRQGRSPRFLDTIARMIPQEMRQSRGIKLHAQQGVASVDVE